MGDILHAGGCDSSPFLKSDMFTVLALQRQGWTVVPFIKSNLNSNAMDDPVSSEFGL
jgi:hypothetical protein